MDSFNRMTDSREQLYDQTESWVMEDAARGVERDLPRGEASVRNLAKALTGQFTYPDCDSSFGPEKQRFLDPNSPDFNARDWAKAFYNLRYAAEGISPRKAGIAFRSLNVYGYGTATDYQMSVGNAALKLGSNLANLLAITKKPRVNILQGLDGLVLPGEQLCVLGPPGSGCSTFMKTIAGDTLGLEIDPQSYLNYHGITAKQMMTQFRGEAIYTAEMDQHFPVLTVGETLYFAALARAPRTIPGGLSREEYATHQRDVIMAMFGISHTKDTPVGNDFMRGVSGGERKRVSIAEAALSYAPLQCWDNSTRGLDTANATEFCKTLRLQGDIFRTTSCVAIYQAPQAAYNLFHKVIVLYDGRQIFFGRASEAKDYFEALGFECPSSQTTPDFLTSMTCPTERIVKVGFENLVPRTAEEFAQRWRDSPKYENLLNQIQQYTEDHRFNTANMWIFAAARKSEKSTRQRERSPYTLSYWRQIRLCMWRELHRIKANPAVTIFTILVNLIQNIIIGSVFFNLKAETASFIQRGALMFLMIVLSALSSVLEIMALYDKRSTVEKHSRYALYHPSAEAIASSIMDIPSKLVMCICSNITVYFMAGLRRTPEAFFFYLLMAFTSMMCMSMFFRFFASMTKTVAQATAPVSIINMALSLYTGFALPSPYILGWARWIYYINPIAYAFEAIMVNEFHGRDLPCSTFVPSGPGYENVDPLERTCSTVGAVPGSPNVDGDNFLEQSYRFSWAHRWRDFGILVGFTVFFTILYLVGSELVTGERSKGEVLVFRRSQMHNSRLKRGQVDEEQTKRRAPCNDKSESSGDQLSQVDKQTAVFHWRNVCYDITANGQQKRLLDNVDGWIKPGSLTALMVGPLELPV